MRCGTRVSDTNTQAIETSPNQSARNFLIHEVEKDGSPLSLHGLHLKATAQGASDRQDECAREASAFVQVYHAAHAAVSDDSLRLRRDDQLLCASIAFVRMVDVAIQHIYSVSKQEQIQLETSAVVSELFNHLHTHFPHVEDAKLKNQLRNYVLRHHPARLQCNDKKCRPGFCTGGAGDRCRKSRLTLALVERLNDGQTSFQTALDEVRTYLGPGAGTAASHVVHTHTPHMSFTHTRLTCRSHTHASHVVHTHTPHMSFTHTRLTRNRRRRLHGAQV
jgi:hypothetical protein